MNEKYEKRNKICIQLAGWDHDFCSAAGWCSKEWITFNVIRLFSSYKIVGISLDLKVTIIQIHNNLRQRRKVPPIRLIFYEKII